MAERKPIFYDQERRRWRRTRLVLELTGALFTLVLVVFLLNVVRNPELPELLRPDTRGGLHAIPFGPKTKPPRRGRKRKIAALGKIGASHLVVDNGVMACALDIGVAEYPSPKQRDAHRRKVVAADESDLGLLVGRSRAAGNVELGLNARKIDFEGTISQDTLNLSSSKSLSLYLPMVYAGVQVKPISYFAIEGEFRGIAIGQNHFYDYIAKIRVNPVPIFYISGGYRSEDIKIDQSAVTADVKFSGPFVEVGLSF